MIKRILGLRRLWFSWPWLKKYQRRLRSVSNAIVWQEFWGSKLPDALRYVACPGCGVRIDLEEEESWRRRDDPCEDGNYWCMSECCDPPYTCGCVLSGEEAYPLGFIKGYREDGQ